MTINRNPLQQKFDFDGVQACDVQHSPLEQWQGRVHRLRPPVKAHGGKYYLAKQIVPILMAVRSEVEEYLEPCVFGGSVYLALPRFTHEFIGDVNPDVVNLWRVLARQSVARELLDIVVNTPYVVDEFDKTKDQAFDAVTQAARFMIGAGFHVADLVKHLRGLTVREEESQATQTHGRRSVRQRFQKSLIEPGTSMSFMIRVG